MVATHFVSLPCDYGQPPIAASVQYCSFAAGQAGGVAVRPVDGSGELLECVPTRGVGSRNSFVGPNAHPGMPRIDRRESVCVLFSVVAGLAKTLADRCFVARWQDELPLEELRAIRRRRRARRPYVRREVVVIPARRHEECARVAPHHLVEAESAMVKRFGQFETTDVQMDVPHRCTRRRAVPRDTRTLRDDIIDVERIGCHREFAPVVLPSAWWSIGVDLDAQTVRIGEVERLAHEVIRHSDANTKRCEVCREPPERRPSGRRIAK